MWYTGGYDGSPAPRPGRDGPPRYGPGRDDRAPYHRARSRYDADFGPMPRRGYDAEMRARRRAEAYDREYGARVRGRYDADLGGPAWWTMDPAAMWDPLFGWAGMPAGTPFGPGPIPGAHRAGPRDGVPPRRSPLYGEGGDRALRRWARRYGHDFERAIRPPRHDR